MTKLIAALAVLGLAVALQTCVLMYGWGLEPKSWWWIIGGGVFGWTVVRKLADHVEKSKS